MSADMLMIDFDKIDEAWEEAKKQYQITGWTHGIRVLKRLGVVECEHENEDDGHCRNCNNRGWITK